MEHKTRSETYWGGGCDICGLDARQSLRLVGNATREREGGWGGKGEGGKRWMQKSVAGRGGVANVRGAREVGGKISRKSCPGVHRSGRVSHGLYVFFAGVNISSVDGQCNCPEKIRVDNRKTVHVYRNTRTKHETLVPWSTEHVLKHTGRVAATTAD